MQDPRQTRHKVALFRFVRDGTAADVVRTCGAILQHKNAVTPL